MLFEALHLSIMQLYQIDIVWLSPGRTFYEHCNVRRPRGPHPWLRLRPQQCRYLFTTGLFNCGFFINRLHNSPEKQYWTSLVNFVKKADMSLVLYAFFQADVRPTCTFKLTTRLG